MTCPSCGGSQLAGHPAGWLALQHRVTSPLDTAEDATRNSDHELMVWGRRDRPATDTERLLLAALGHVLPAELTTVVSGRGGGYRRTWPQLEPEPEPAA